MEKQYPNMTINWFPGHMAKALRELEENLKKIDLVLCVLDARAPYSCINLELEKRLNGKKLAYIINKTDLADEAVTKEWIKYFEAAGKTVVSVSATGKSSKKAIISCINDGLRERVAKQKARGITLINRVAVVGVPNTGKSTIINSLAGSYMAKTGNLAGVTRSSSWIKIGGSVELMDNAGTLYPKLAINKVAENLAFIGSVSDNAVDELELSKCLLFRLFNLCPQKLAGRYEIDLTASTVDILFNQIALSRGYILKGEKIDEIRTAKAIIDDFRKGKIGKISLETPKEEYVK